MGLKNKMRVLSLLAVLGLTTIHSQDWADFNRFKEANTEL